ncbi:MAG: flagellar hook-length control protein FliK [Nitrospirota bacterium]|nr:flagellar hook-length control protein FliK [Nitrospirota bacterium]
MTEILRAGLLNILGELGGKKGLQGLKVGDILAATVLEKSTGEVLLSLKGEKIAARSEVALSVGDRIFLKVEDLSGKVVLKVVGGEASGPRQAGDLIRERAPQAMNVGGDYSELRGALKELLQKSPALREGSLGALLGQLEQLLPEEGASPAKLKAFVENSGIFYERKLAASFGKETGAPPSSGLPTDLKSLILEAKVLARNAMESHPALQQDIGRFIDVSEKVLKQAEVARPDTAPPVREGAQTTPRGGITMQEGEGAKGGFTRQAAADFSDLRIVVSHLLEKAPALKNGPLGELLVRLEQAMSQEETPTGKPEALTGKPEAPVKSENISAAQQRGVMAREAEPGLPATDLKALILDAKESAKAVLERNPGLRGELDRFLDVSERVLRNTEIVQLANSLTPASQNAFWVVLPYGEGDKTGSVEWEMHQGSDIEGVENQSFSLTFNLSGLGHLKVDGLLSGGRLNCHFWGADEEKARFMEDHLAEFSRSAEAGGVTVGSLACGVSRDSGGSHLHRVMTSSGTRLVDRRA